MMDSKQFRQQAHQFVDWMADYLENIEEYPVKPAVNPGDIFNQLPGNPPAKSEQIQNIFDDFKEIIIPGMTHWQSPNFFAYFPANSSYPSVLAEMLTATMGAQCMIWATSPAAAELEEKMMEWLKQMLNIPAHFSGVIQDTASTATLTALLTAREKASNFNINQKGFQQNNYRIYCSSETHSSIEKDVKIAGFGKENLVKVLVDRQYRLDPLHLEKAIQRDIEAGLQPLCIIATLGTTGSTAIDPLDKIAALSSKYKLWLHVDAAFAGTALLLEEYHWMIKGIEAVDSFVFNPHKWMFTNFDLSAYFVKDRQALINTFSINPEYLKTSTDGMVNDYRDWGVPLGRRFRALKLWFVIRSFGLDGLKEKVKTHITLAQEFEDKIVKHPWFEMITPRTLNLLCFRYKPSGNFDEEQINLLNQKLINDVNNTGRAFLSHTKLSGKYTLRLVIGQTYVTRRHVEDVWELILQKAQSLSK